MKQKKMAANLPVTRPEQLATDRIQRNLSQAGFVSNQTVSLEQASSCSTLRFRLRLAKLEIHLMDAQLQSIEKIVQNQSFTPANAKILQRRCDRCREKEKFLRGSSISSAPDTVPPIVHDVLRSPGHRSIRPCAPSWNRASAMISAGYMRMQRRRSR